MGWPTFRERRAVEWLRREVLFQTGAPSDELDFCMKVCNVHMPVCNAKMGDVRRRQFAAEAELETAREQHAQLNRLLDGLTEHCQDLNTEINALVERETVLSNRITELESRESTLDQAEKDVIAAADQLAAEREQWELQFK